MRRCVLAGVVVLCTASASFAYRPFDGTDAAVAERGVLEVELGPAGLLRLGPDRFLVAPALIANLGFADRWELVLEGRQHLLLGSAPPDEPRSRLVDTAVSVKSVLREGALQDRRGPSVAAEVGVLLPTVNDEPGIGAQAAGIVSQRFGPVTAHFNAAAALARAKRLDLIGSVILEGPWSWSVRPVFEVFSQLEGAERATFSALAGLIWPWSDSLAFDTALRLGRASGQPLLEARLGLTFSLDLLGAARAAAGTSAAPPRRLARLRPSPDRR